MLSKEAAKRLQAEAWATARETVKRRAARRRFVPYQFEPGAYILEQLGWSPWSGTGAEPGQAQVVDAYRTALLQQYERLDYERGKPPGELTHWKPGQTIQNRLRVEAGHTVGKTYLAAGLVSHFFDCFAPSIIYTFAPTYPQINNLLWKDIRAQRRANPTLPGRILETPEMRVAADHFAMGRATSDAHGRGTERVQGQHGRYLMFVLDEAEGVADYVFRAVESMTSGGISIVLMLANPRTRRSTFFKQRTRSDVENFRISCMHHPNVRLGRELVPGAVRREYVLNMLEEHAAQVEAHNDDEHTFELPWEPGTIYRPDAEFMFRVLGVPPANVADDVFVSPGRYEAATKRAAQPIEGEAKRARMGVDAARYGSDAGTLYVAHGGAAWRAGQFRQQSGKAYYRAVRKEAIALAAKGVRSIQVRVDAGGGFGGGVVDDLKEDLDLQRMFEEFAVIEVHFNGKPYDAEAYADLATEMYAEAAESLKRVALVAPPPELDADLTERRYRWVNVGGVSVKKLESKEELRKPSRLGRSPDDGDGCVLALAPDHLFAAKVEPVQAQATVVTAGDLGL